MKKSRYTDEPLAFALKRAETGTPVAEVIRRMWILERRMFCQKSSDAWASANDVAVWCSALIDRRCAMCRTVWIRLRCCFAFPSRAGNKQSSPCQ